MESKLGLNKIFTSFNCKLIFLIIPFLNEIPLLMPVFNPLMKGGMFFAAAYIIYDLFTRRETFKMSFILPSIILIASIFIGTALNYSSPQLKMNIIELLYVITSLIVLLQVPENYTKEQCYKEIRIINFILIVLITITSVVSLIMYYSKITFEITYNNYTYRMGVYNGRLVGLFRNSIYPTAAIGTICGFVQLFVNREYYNLKSCAKNKLIVASIIINANVTLLQNSKGIFIGLLCAVFFVLFFVFAKYEKLYFIRKRPLPIQITAAVMGGGAGAAVVRLAALIGKKINYCILFLISFFSDKFSNNGEAYKKIGDNVKEYMERTVGEQYGMLTGRPYIWMTGLKSFLKQPLFGYGPYTLADTIRPYEGSTEQISHFHNILIHTLVSGGVIGLTAFLVITVCSAVVLIKSLWKNSSRKDYIAFVLMISMIVFMFVINMADTTILYMTKHSGFVFFIYLGYILALSGEKREFIFDRPIRILGEKIAKK